MKKQEETATFKVDDVDIIELVDICNEIAVESEKIADVSNMASSNQEQKYATIMSNYVMFDKVMYPALRQKMGRVAMRMNKKVKDQGEKNGENK